MEDLIIQIIPITMLMVEGIKNNKKVKGVYYFLASILIAVSLSILFRGFSREAVALGIYEGLTAAGAFSGIKSFKTDVNPPKLF